MKTQSTTTILQRGVVDRKVSVIVPLHNYAHLIEETLDSVAAQTFTDLALIVIDDASTDTSRAVAEDWMRRSARQNLAVALLANTANAGLSVTRNTGVAYSNSTYCFFLDADNILLPRCIDKHVRALDARADCFGAFSIIEEFDGNKGLIGNNVFARDRLGRGNYIDAMTMLRRETLAATEGFYPIKHGWEDYELWLRLCEQDKYLIHIPEVLSRYRNHRGSMLRQQTNVDRNIWDLHGNIEQLHPWVKLDAPVSPRRQVREPAELRHVAPVELKTNVRASQRPYAAYAGNIIAKVAEVSRRLPRPVDLEIDTEFTGPALGSPFDSFQSDRQRLESASVTKRMLKLGIVAVNPRPGVHAARDDEGKFTRYRSIAVKTDPIRRLPSSWLMHIHAFYPDVLKEMLDCFDQDARNARFVITTTSRSNVDVIKTLITERSLTSADVILTENRGRDIGPFLDHALNAVRGEQMLGHIHTKKSPDIGGSYGEKWRNTLYGALLTQAAVDAFDDHRLGLIFPDFSRSVGWGKNRSTCAEIAENLDQSLPPQPGPIPVGNMFFARVEVVKAMREATRALPWPREPVPYDGSVLHAIERMWPMACHRVDFEWAAIQAIADQPA